MVRFNRLFGLAGLLWPLWLGAQTQPDLARILERLDRLERDNRALSEEVRSLRARLDSTGESKTGPATCAISATWAISARKWTGLLGITSSPIGSAFARAK